MASWVTVPCLLSLRSEFNELSPERDKGADGTIGDTNHTSSSDHTPDEDSSVLRGKDADSRNEVHALDIDSSGPWPGEGTQKQRFHRIVMRIIAGEKKKWLDPDDVCRLEYIIWDRKIYHRSNNFEPRDYTKDDPHTNHGHFSARYLTRSENDTRPWGVIPQTVEDIHMDFGDFITSVARSLDDSQTDQPGDVANRKALDKTVRYMTKVALSAISEVAQPVAKK